MKIRVLIFSRDEEAGKPVLLKFGLMGEANSFSHEIENVDAFLKDFSAQNSLRHHPDFASLIKESHPHVYLFEYIAQTDLPAHFTLSSSKQNVRWLLWKEAVPLLKDGRDKVFLQMIIQYLATENAQELDALELTDSVLKNVQTLLKEEI